MIGIASYNVTKTMTPPKTLDFKCAVITGGGGGIGLEMAKYLKSQGKKIILVGRTESKLQDAVKELGSDTTYYVLDTGKVADIPSFVECVTADHPDVDCLINNAGIQRPFDIKDGLDLAKADQELDINIRGPLHLAITFLPHLRTKKGGAVIMNVTSVLGFIPFSIINPVYNGTKAWAHSWSMNLRTQLKDTNIRVVEIVPPSVATDLHRERSDPHDNDKEKNQSALSLEEFMDELTAGWKENKDCIGAGMAAEVVDRWYRVFGPDYQKAAGTI